MSETELRLLIAQLAEGVALLDREVGSLASSVVAMRDAMLEYDPADFEPLYSKHYEGEAATLIRRRSEENSALLYTLVYGLRKPQ
jgi:hypothetical protein